MLPSDRLETIFLVFGMIVGVLFVIDGWRGSPKTRDFRASPRIRAFTWVIGGFISTLVLDIKKFGVNLPDDKVGILGEYLFGFAIAVGLTLLVTIAILVVQAIWSQPQRKRTLSNITGFPFLPILHFLHYGFDRFCEVRDAGLEQQELSESEAHRQYLTTYSGELAAAIATVNHFRETGGDADTVARLILRSIAQLTEKQLHLSARLNVNYMRAYEAQSCPDGIKEKSRFVYGNTARYSHYLALVQYANDLEREVFALPVEPVDGSGKIGCLLPGAPVAFRTNQMVYVEDTARMEYPASLERTIVQSLKIYFEGKKFKSFLSIPILGRDGMPVGVLNIDSNQKGAFGKSEEERESIAITVLPFCALLGAIIMFAGEER